MTEGILGELHNLWLQNPLCPVGQIAAYPSQGNPVKPIYSCLLEQDIMINGVIDRADIKKKATSGLAIVFWFLPP